MSLIAFFNVPGRKPRRRPQYDVRWPDGRLLDNVTRDERGWHTRHPDGGVATYTTLRELRESVTAPPYRCVVERRA